MSPGHMAPINYTIYKEPIALRNNQTTARLSASDCAFIAEERLRDPRREDGPLPSRSDLGREIAVAVEWMEAALK